MIKNYKPSEVTHEDWYQITFMYDSDSGFGFNCDEDGNLLPMPEGAKENYLFCMAHPEKFETWNEKVKYTRTVRTNASGTCRCGEEIELTSTYLGACECPNCGQWYNVFGEELLPPEEWEI